MVLYFCRRFNDDKMKELNNILKLRGKIRTLQLSTKFLKECVIKRVSLRFITFRIKKFKVQPSPTIERAFINDEIGKNRTKSQKLHRTLTAIWSKVKCFFSYFDWIRFYRYLAGIEQRKQNRIEAKHFKNLNWLQKQRFGSVSSNSGCHINNLLNYKLLDTEQFVLAHGLDFC